MDSGESLQKAPPNTPEPVLRAASESDGDDDDGPPPPEPLSSKVPIPSAQLSLYRAAVAIRAVLLALFLRYRATHTVQHDAYALWLTSVACECCLALSWLLAQLTKLSPTHRATRLHALEKEEKDGGKQHLASVDVFVTAADAAREPPLATANTVLSVLAADYPPGRLACYVSDDGADALLFEVLRETARLARTWVPFCRAHGVEPRAPEPYFARGVDYIRDKVAPSFVRERRKVKREYEEFKVRLNRLAAATARARRVPEEGWVMSDGTPWPGNDPRDHPAMVQLLLGHAAGDDAEASDELLPRLVYVSREKRPGFQHRGKAGAMNALLRVSAVLTNGAYVLNLDYDHYVNNSGAMREAMCFMMDPAEAGNRTCFVQFPLRPAVAAAADDAGHDSVFFNIDMKCLDGIQGPVYVGSGCCFNRKALYGFDPAVADDADDLEAGRRKWCCFGARESRKMRLKRTMSVVPLLDSEDEDEETERARKRRLRSYHAALERHFGLSPSFIASVFGEPGIGGSPRPAAMAVSPLLTEAIINVISCAYEERTRWGREFGWIYGAGASGGVATATGFRMHARGWESAYCVPTRPAFRSYAGRSASEMLAGASRQAAADMGVLLSRHCPVWDAGSGMKPLQRLAYVNRVAYPLASLPLTVYCALSAVCLLSGKSIFPDDVGYDAGVLLVLLLSSVITSVALELKWSGVSLREWWRDEKLWVVLGTSAGLAAVFLGIIRACTGIDVAFSTDTTAASVSNQEAEDDDDEEVPENRFVQWSNLLVPPISVLLGNLAGAVVAFSYGVDHGYESWGPLAWRLLFAAWVVAHLQGFLRGLLARRERAPTIAVLWSVLFVSILSLLWVNVQTYYAPAAATHQPIF